MDLYFGAVLKKINEEVERQVNQNIKGYNITMTQAKVLLFLSEAEHYTVTQKQLEDFLDVSHPTTVTIVRSMESKKLIRTSVDEDDRRMKLVTLVRNDKKMHEYLRENAQQMEEKLLQDFSKEEREQFKFLLQKTYNNITH